LKKSGELPSATPGPGEGLVPAPRPAIKSGPKKPGPLAFATPWLEPVLIDRLFSDGFRHGELGPPRGKPSSKGRPDADSHSPSPVAAAPAALLGDETGQPSDPSRILGLLSLCSAGIGMLLLDGVGSRTQSLR